MVLQKLTFLEKRDTIVIIGCNLIQDVIGYDEDLHLVQ
jgi:hypothetical protein